MAKSRTHKQFRGVCAAVTLLLLFIVAAAPSLASPSYWSEYGGRPDSAGFVTKPTSHFEDSLNLSSSSSVGMAYQALAAPFVQGSAQNYLILFSGNFLQFYDKGLNLIDELNVGAVQSQPTTFKTAANHTAVLFMVSNALKAYSYNGSAFVSEWADATGLNDSKPCTAWTGLKCSGDYCYAFCDVTGSANDLMIKADLAAGTYENRTLTGTGSLLGTPSIAEISGKDVAAVLCDPNGNTHYGFCLANLSSTNMGVGLKVDGITVAQVDRISNPVIYNIDGAGTPEVLVAFSTGSGAQNNLRAYKPDGSAAWTLAPTQANGGLYFGTPVIVQTSSGGSCSGPSWCTYTTATSCTSHWLCSWEPNHPDICYTSSDNSKFNYFCANYQGALVGNRTLASMAYATAARIPLVAANVKEGNESSTAEVVLPGMVMTGTAHMTTLQDFKSIVESTYYVSYADLDSDNEGEIIATKSGTTKVLGSSYTFPLLSLQSAYTLGQNYLSPVCAGSTVTYSAKECGVVPCQYANPNTFATERLTSSCGQENTSVGDWSQASPTLGCLFPTAGNYPSFEVCVQDDLHSSDLTNCWTETIYVINGTPGVSCNLAVPACTGTGCAAATPSSTAAAGTDIDAAFNDLVFGSSMIKTIIVLIATMILIIFMAVKGVQNPMVHAGAVFALWTCCAMLGFISFIYVVIYAVVIGLGSAVYWVKGGTGGG